MSRYSDVHHVAPDYQLPPLPVVDWRGIGRSAPAPVAIDYQGPDAPLPAADVAVLTWTSAEWSALDHVFVTSDDPHVNSSWTLERTWHQYSPGVAGASTDNPQAPLWGFYQLVDIATGAGDMRKVLLFKADAHLAHPPWIDGLIQMVDHVITDASPAWIYSIGTAGGSREDLRLGDVVITNAGHIELKNPENAGVKIAGETFTGTAFPSTSLLETAQELFVDMSSVVTDGALAAALQALHAKVPDSAPFAVADLLNSALDPASLKQSRAVPMEGTPLLTTDYYYIASGPDAEQWAVLEMDDAVIAYAAQEKDTNYAFVRNVSDPLVPTQTPAGVTIPDDVRDGWSGQIYQGFGLYTSFNGALTTWAAIAA
jgi:hypothetical protein